jgi:hypothetical protein
MKDLSVLLRVKPLPSTFSKVGSNHGTNIQVREHLKM